MDGGGAEKDLVSEGLRPSERKETSGPETGGDQGDVLQSSGLGLVSSQDLTDECSHVRADTREVRGTAQVGGQGGSERVLKTASQEGEVEVLRVGGTSQDTGGGQEGGSNGEKRNGLLDINFEGFGVWDDEPADDGSADVADDALRVEEELARGTSLNGTGGSDGGVGPGTGHGGGSHLGSVDKSGKRDGVDGSGIEGEGHTHTYSGLGRERHELGFLGLGRNREDVLKVSIGIDRSGLGSIRRRQTGRKCQVACKNGGEELHDVFRVVLL